MRIALLLVQFGVVCCAYMAFVIPVLAAFSGLMYMLVTDPELVLAFTVALSLQWLMQALLVAVGAAAAAPAATATFAGVGSTLFILALPMIASVLANFFYGFVVYRPDRYVKARRRAIAVNVFSLCCYLALHIFLICYLLDERRDASAGEWLAKQLPVLAAMAVWDGYFVVSILLWWFMPKRPDIALSLERIPQIHVALWTLFALAYAVLLAFSGASVGWVSIGISLFVLLLAVPFVYNAGASRKIASERRKLYAFGVFLANVVAAIFFLLLLPPVGALWLLSAALLYFLLEMTVMKWPGVRPEGVPAALQDADGA